MACCPRNLLDTALYPDSLILTALQYVYICFTNGLSQLEAHFPAGQQLMHAHGLSPATAVHSSGQGRLAAFSIVSLGDFGDKTFFTAALLAVQVGRLVSFIGSMLALAAMSLIWVGIGSAFAAAPLKCSSGGSC
jgi:hypothetical protein